MGLKKKRSWNVDNHFDSLRMSEKDNDRKTGHSQYERKREDKAVLYVCVNWKQFHCKQISNQQRINNTAEHHTEIMNVVRSKINSM